jgi:Recombination endonuclease VII
MSATRKPTRAKQLGVTDLEYAAILAAQGGHCALCLSTPKSRRLHVDHNHATGEVRGLLCHRCNRALPTWVTRAWLWNAVLYLDDDSLEAGALKLYARPTT